MALTPEQIKAGLKTLKPTQITEEKSPVIMPSTTTPTTNIMPKVTQVQPLSPKQNIMSPSLEVQSGIQPEKDYKALATPEEKSKVIRMLQAGIPEATVRAGFRQAIDRRLTQENTARGQEPKNYISPDPTMSLDMYNQQQAMQQEPIYKATQSIGKGFTEMGKQTLEGVKNMAEGTSNLVGRGIDTLGSLVGEKPTFAPEGSFGGDVVDVAHGAIAPYFSKIAPVGTTLFNAAADFEPTKPIVEKLGEVQQYLGNKATNLPLVKQFAETLNPDQQSKLTDILGLGVMAGAGKVAGKLVGKGIEKATPYVEKVKAEIYNPNKIIPFEAGKTKIVPTKPIEPGFKNKLAEGLVSSYLKNPAEVEKYKSKTGQTPAKTILEAGIKGNLQEQGTQILSKGKQSAQLARTEASKIPETFKLPEGEWITNKVIEGVDTSIPGIGDKLKPIVEMNNRFKNGTATANDIIDAKTMVSRYEQVYDDFGRVKKTGDVFEKEALANMYNKMKTTLEDSGKKYNVDFEAINKETMKWEGLRKLITRAISREEGRDNIGLTDYVLGGYGAMVDPVSSLLLVGAKKIFQMPRVTNKVANMLYSKEKVLPIKKPNASINNDSMILNNSMDSGATKVKPNTSIVPVTSKTPITPTGVVQEATPIAPVPTVQTKTPIVEKGRATHDPYKTVTMDTKVVAPKKTVVPKTTKVKQEVLQSTIMKTPIVPKTLPKEMPKVQPREHQDYIGDTKQNKTNFVNSEEPMYIKAGITPTEIINGGFIKKAEQFAKKYLKNDKPSQSRVVELIQKEASELKTKQLKYVNTKLQEGGSNIMNAKREKVRELNNEFIRNHTNKGEYLQDTTQLEKALEEAKTKKTIVPVKQEVTQSTIAPKTVNVWIKSKFSNEGAYKDIPVIEKVDNITLYQGGSDGKRQFWTKDKKYAEQFGKVQEKTGSFYKVDNGNRVTDVYVEATAPKKQSVLPKPQEKQAVLEGKKEELLFRYANKENINSDMYRGGTWYGEKDLISHYKNKDKNIALGGKELFQAPKKIEKPYSVNTDDYEVGKDILMMTKFGKSGSKLGYGERPNFVKDILDENTYNKVLDIVFEKEDDILLKQLKSLLPKEEYDLISKQPFYNQKTMTVDYLLSQKLKKMGYDGIELLENGKKREVMIFDKKSPVPTPKTPVPTTTEVTYTKSPEGKRLADGKPIKEDSNTYRMLDRAEQRKLDAKKAKESSVSKELQPLYQEAKKYKSAEEFIKSNFIAHGTDKEIIGNIRKSGGTFGEGVYFTEDIKNAGGIGGSKNTYFIERPNKKDIVKIDLDERRPKGMDFEEVSKIRAKLVELYKKKGLKGIEIPEAHTNGKSRFMLFDDQKPIEQSQLRKIREEANTTNKVPVKTPVPVKKVEPVSKELQPLYDEAKKYKTADEYLEGLRSKLEKDMDILTQKAKKQNPTDPTGYNTAKNVFLKDRGITDADMSLLENNKYADIKGMEDTYKQYVSRGQSDFASQQKAKIESAKKSNTLFDKYDKIMDDRDEFFKKNEKKILMQRNKWMTDEEANKVLQIKNMPTVPELRKIREEAQRQ